MHEDRRRALVIGAAALAWTRASLGAAAPIRIGVPAGPEAELLERAQELAATQGLALRLDVRPPGRDLADDVASGALDAAIWTDGVRFSDEAAHHHGELVVAAAMFTLPTALYSRRLANLRALRDGDALALPIEPAAQARALVLLHNFGLLTLRDDIGLHARLRDVVANPHGLRLVALPAPRLYEALARIPVVAMDYDSATQAGLQPARDSIGLEDARTPFGGVLAVRRDGLARPWLAQLLAVVHGEPLRHFAFERFNDSVRRPW